MYTFTAEKVIRLFVFIPLENDTTDSEYIHFCYKIHQPIMRSDKLNCEIAHLYVLHDL